MNNITEYKMEYFINNTIDPNEFVINNVIGDNSCLYRSLANYIFYAVPSMDIKHIKEFKKWGDVKDISVVLKYLGYQSYQQEYIARLVQQKIVKYARDNPDKILTDDIGISIKDYIPVIHDISYDEYIQAYSTFAGEKIDENKNNMEDDIINCDRWGSNLELLIISDLLKCPIVIFTSQRYNLNKNKIETGIINSNIINGLPVSKPHKNVRLKVLQVIGKEYIHNKLPIYLIWKKHKKLGHYMACYPKQHNELNNVIKNIV